MWAPSSDWTAPVLSELPSWKGQRRVGFDTEFKDVNLRKMGCGARRAGTYIAGYSFAFEDGRKHYIPLRHPEGNVDHHQGLYYLRDNAREFDGELVGANLPIDVDMANNDRDVPIQFPKVKKFKDILVAAPLVYELDHGYGLQDVSERYGFPGKREDLLMEAAQAFGANITKDTWKAIVPDLPAKYVGVYGEDDAFRPLQILPVLEKRLAEQGALRSWDIESDLSPILLKLRQRGVLIDFDHLDKVEAWARKEEIDLLAAIHHITGVRIPPGGTMKVGVCVPAFAAVGIVVPQKRDPKTKKYKYSLDKEFLASIKHPVAEKFLLARQMGKLYGTFCKQVRDYSTNGRLHTTFRQIIGANEKNEKSGAAFGRLSSAKPNLQQQPSRAKHANFFRKIYLPEPGTHWGCLDFSQQEPRWTTHFAALLNLKGAREAAQEYHRNVKLDNHDFMAKLTGLERTYAKNIFLGLCYGEGGAKLCRELGLSTRWCVRYRKSGAMEYFDTKALAVRARKDYEGEASYYEAAGEEGQAILNKFNDRAPYIKLLARKAEERARETGVIRVLGDRVIHFPMKNDGTYDWSYKALNRLIQGTSGMQVKMALIAIHREMPEVFLQLQVHDELDGSFLDVQSMRKCAKIMREVQGQTCVPFRIDIEMGPNWGTLKQLCGNDNCTDFVDKKLEINGVKETYWCPTHARQEAA